MTLQDIFNKTMIQLHLSPKQKVVVALSGGADSVALLSLAQSYFKQVIAAHVNYGLRGEESEGDHNYCMVITETYQIPLHVKRVTVEEKEDGNQNHYRELRYRYFAEVCEMEQTNILLVAHHKEDQAETVFAHLMKGAGVSGLSGMKLVSPSYGLKVVRPLLPFRKQELISYLNQCQISYRTDSSNLKTDYQRNQIRLETLPQLNETYGVNMHEGLYKLSETMQEIEDMFLHYYDTIQKEHVSDKKVHLEQIQEQYHVAIVKQFLYFYFKRNLAIPHVSQVHILDVLQLPSKDTGTKMYLPQGWVVKKRRDGLLFQRDEPTQLSPFSEKIPLGRKTWINELHCFVTAILTNDKTKEGIYIPVSSKTPSVEVCSYEEGAKIRNSPSVRKKVKKEIKSYDLKTTDVWYVKVDGEVRYVPQLSLQSYFNPTSYYLQFIIERRDTHG